MTEEEIVKQVKAIIVDKLGVEESEWQILVTCKICHFRFFRSAAPIYFSGNPFGMANVTFSLGFLPSAFGPRSTAL